MGSMEATNTNTKELAMFNAIATTSAPNRLARIGALVGAVALFVGFSIIVTATQGELSFICLPMLAAAIALLVAHDRLETADTDLSAS